jgi:TrmH family RNA methyltransferase
MESMSAAGELIAGRIALGGRSRSYNGRMLSEDELQQVCVVLVRARNPANIGAVARAMHDFGFVALRVVNEFALPYEAAKSAVDASAVMERAAIYASVAEAVEDCTLVVGTTAVGERDLLHPLLTLAEAGAKIRAELRRGRPEEDADDTKTEGTHRALRSRVAVLFGSEKTGLSNEEMSHCDWLLTIPMQEYAGMRHPSMNLGQAVAVCLYELVRRSGGRVHDDEAVMNRARGIVPGTADAGTLERLTGLLVELMEKTEYARRHAANSSEEDVRRLVRRMGADAVDAPVWMGFLRQVLWKLGRGGA